MDQAAETRYVAVGEADVAYQVIGTGPIDLLYFYGLGTHVEVLPLVPGFPEFLKRLSTFCRVILFDRRGTGASEGVAGRAIPTFEEWTEDVQAVLDAAGSQHAAILAAMDAGPIALLFAAMHPERVRALVLLNTTARYLEAPDYPIGATIEQIEALVETLATIWGTVDFARVLNPGKTDDDAYLRDVARWTRFAATPRTVAAQYDYILRHLDVRQALPLVQVPTRVLHVKDNPLIPIEHGRYLVDHIEGATLVELPGGNLSIAPNFNALIDETTEFLTGERPPVEIERVLTTVLVTDIVGSTSTAASIGAQRWRTLLDEHDHTVREQLRQFRGREIKNTGDGFLVSFDGPARAIRCAATITEAIRRLGIELRVGVHTGECDVRGDDLGGLAVHIAARIAASATPGSIVVSSTVRDLVIGSGIEFEDQGEHELKGVPGTWRLCAVSDHQPW